MANSWLRLWHDFPNDPKWRTIARASNQPISLVISVYLHMLVDASTAEERGRTQVNAEDVASALDVSTDCVLAVLAAMDGRVIEGGRLSGWEKRQPNREDNSAERGKEWRERKRTQANADEPKIKTKKRVDKEEKTEFLLPDFVDQELWEAFEVQRKNSKKTLTPQARNIALNRLVKAKAEGFDVKAIMERAIEGMWQTFHYDQKSPKAKVVYREMTPEQAAWQAEPANWGKDEGSWPS